QLALGGVRPQPPPRRPPAGRRPVGTEVVLGPARFDAGTGRLRELHGLPVAGPVFELWRGPTDNDRSEARGSFELAGPEETFGEGAPGPSSESRWRAHGLDRLTSRLRDLQASEEHLDVLTRVAAADSARTVDVGYRWSRDPAEPGTIWLRVEVVPSPDWDCTWPRVGVRLDLPTDFEAVEWYGTGPRESYPDSRAAARVGRYTATVEELNVAYSRPQETGHRAELRQLVVSGDGRRLIVRTQPGAGGHRPGFTLTRHTPHDLDRARHPYELPRHDRIFLYLDEAVHGLGSRACGIDVLPQHALWPRACTFTVGFPDPTA
ncbi:MAG: beta-galactosidase small subunit, partial [Actinomycetes bacterium]